MSSFLERLAGTVTVPFLLVGGHALQAYGYVRMTLDTDIVVGESQAHLLDAELQAGGFELLASNHLVWRYSSPGSDETLDVLVVADTTYGKMAEQAKKFPVTGCAIPDLSVLLAMKLHAIKQDPSRTMRDLADVEALLRANPDAVSPDAWASIIAKHAPGSLVTFLKSLR